VPAAGDATDCGVLVAGVLVAGVLVAGVASGAGAADDVADAAGVDVAWPSPPVPPLHPLKASMASVPTTTERTPRALLSRERRFVAVGFGKDFTSPDIFVPRCRCSSAIT
jgi:hypothetical protein